EYFLPQLFDHIKDNYNDITGDQATKLETVVLKYVENIYSETSREINTVRGVLFINNKPLSAELVKLETINFLKSYGISADMQPEALGEVSNTFKLNREKMGEALIDRCILRDDKELSGFGQLQEQFVDDQLRQTTQWNFLDTSRLTMSQENTEAERNSVIKQAQTKMNQGSSFRNLTAFMNQTYVLDVKADLAEAYGNGVSLKPKQDLERLYIATEKADSYEISSSNKFTLIPGMNDEKYLGAVEIAQTITVSKEFLAQDWTGKSSEEALKAFQKASSITTRVIYEAP
ncbi:MAG: hypothetical protein WCJ72_17795, partial [Chryseobacterium sp.]